MDKFDRRARGTRAKALLEDDLLSEAFKTLETEYIKALMGTLPTETEARESYYRAANILADVRRHLSKVVNDGKIAQVELDQLGGVNRL